MRRIITFTADDVVPAREVVLENQGVPRGGAVRTDIDRLCDKAISALVGVVTPVCALAEISKDDFRQVYEGDGGNQPRTPVGDIYPKADYLALFAGTLGRRVSAEIDRRFRASEFATGAMLDAAASAAADKLSEVAGARFLELLADEGRAPPGTCVLGYSPGYCGWDISGQRRLFDWLRPEQIGISLNDRFLMQPLKSVSGVLIAGPARIHSCPESYSFCRDCKTRSCQARIRSVLENWSA